MSKYVLAFRGQPDRAQDADEGQQCGAWFAGLGTAISDIANAWHCQAPLRAHGANVPVIDDGPVDHVSSLVLAALPKLLTWFQHLN